MDVRSSRAQVCFGVENIKYLKSEVPKGGKNEFFFNYFFRLFSGCGFQKPMFFQGFLFNVA